MKSIVRVATIGAGIFGLFLWRLGSLTPGISPDEKSAALASQSLQTIQDMPINGFFKIFQYALGQTNLSTSVSLRLVSVIFAVIIIACFYTMVRTWFGRTVGLFSTFLLLGTPLLLVAARQATAEIMYLSPVILMATYYWLLRTEKSYKSAWLLLFVVGASSLYVPGLIWFVVAGTIVARARLFKALKKMPSLLTLGAIVIAATILAPLARAVYKDPAILRTLALLPDLRPEALVALKSIGLMALGLVWQVPYHQPLMLERLPVLNVVAIALGIFGLYAMWTNARAKTYALLSTVGFGIVAAGLNKNPTLLIITLPAVTVFAAAGLRYLHVEWTSIFPRNPLPRTLALILMLALISVHMLFGVRYALVAWPRNVDTTNLYMLQ